MSVLQRKSVMLKHAYILLIYLFLFMANAALSSEIVVARGGDGFYPPCDMIINNTLTGFHIDLVNAVAQKLNINVTFTTYPWKRAVAMLKNGGLDAVTYMTRTEERERFGYFLEGNVLSITQFGFFLLKERAGEIAFSGDLKQLQPYTIGTIRGYSYGQAFDDATYLHKDDGASTEKEQLKKLFGKRFDIGIGVVSRIRYIADQMGRGDQLVFLSPYLEKIPCYIVFSKKKNLEQLAKQFAEAMVLFKKTDSYHYLEKKYGMVEE